MGGMIGAVIGAAGDIAAFESQRKAYIQNTSELQKSAFRSRSDAADALSRGGIAEGQRRMQGSQLLAKQRVAYANSGIEATVGTPADVAASTSLFNEFDAMTIQNNAAREALGHKRTAERYDFQRRQLADQYGDAQTALGIKAAGRFMQFASGGANSALGVG
jgi:hypothetical protein